MFYAENPGNHCSSESLISSRLSAMSRTNTLERKYFFEKTLTSLTLTSKTTSR